MPKVQSLDGNLYLDRAHLISLSSTLLLYAFENDRSFPDIGRRGTENLDILIEYDLSEDTLDYIKDNCFYIQGLTLDDPPETVIAGEAGAEHSYGISYLTIDGRMWPAEIPKRLSYEEKKQLMAVKISAGIGLLAAAVYLLLKIKNLRLNKHITKLKE